jgi:dienelactone hydrolase
MSRRCWAPVGLVVAMLLLGAPLFAAGPRVLPEGTSTQDVRHGALRTLDSYFPFEVPESTADWAGQSELIRRRILVANGLYPMPAPTPANAVVHGLVDRGDYTVERVFFESFPGHFVTGSLYRPKHRNGRMPGVLCPHGHWANGRFYDAGEAEAQKQIASGAEKNLSGARFPLQARCAQLARMGCVVFHYDMVGYADSQQIPAEIAHGFRERRPDMERPDAWGFFSPQAESRLQSIMGVQTYNSIRALDWLCSLPDVDPQRIGVTGASGGGTQTFVLAAIDPRVSVAFPAVMVSTAMQGGCTCENCNYLRTGAGNVDFAACFAPRPLGLTAADDWTKELETKGLPELKRLYALVGAPENVAATIRLEFGHNYNGVSRQAMYEWFAKHMQLTAPATEAEFEPLTFEKMTVWNDAHPRPESGPEHERKLTRAMAEASDAALAADPQRFTRNAYEVIIGRDFSSEPTPEAKELYRKDHGEAQATGHVLTVPGRGEQVLGMLLYPKNTEIKVVVIWIDGQGKAALFDDAGNPKPEIARLLDAGNAVVGVDLIGQGESAVGPTAKEENRRVDEDRNFAGYTYGYNSPLFVQRVHDIMTVVNFTFAHRKPNQRLHLVGGGGAGPLVAAAMVECGDAIDGVAIDTEGFRFAELTDYADARFLPGAVKYGDLPGLLGLVGNRPVWLGGESPAFAEKLEATLGNAQRGGVTAPNKKAEDFSSAVVDWLLSHAMQKVAE